MPARIRVNGVEETLESATVVELLRKRGLDPELRGLAVAVNAALVPRRQWDAQHLSAGDEVEIVRPLQGG